MFLVQMIWCGVCRATTEHQKVHGKWKCKTCGKFNKGV